VFFPSILFWSSSLGKDPIQFFFIGLYAYGGTVWFVQGRLSALGLTGIGLLGTYLLRPWHAFMAGGVLVLATVMGKMRGSQIILLLVVLLPLLFFAGGQILSIFDLQGTLKAEGAAMVQELIVEKIQKNAAGYASESQRIGGSGADFGEVAEGAERTISAPMPLVIFSGFFRPLPFDITNPLTALAAIENTILICLVAAALCRLRLGYLRDPLVIWPALYCLVWAALYGIIVMANFGSGARYKLQMWPFILLLMVGLLHKQGRAWLDSRVTGQTQPVPPPS